MAKHWQDRATSCRGAGRDFASFIREVYEGPFRSDEELEVQLGVGGSLAAQLHDEYVRAGLATILEPVARIDIKLYYSTPGGKPEIVLELVETPIANLLARPGAVLPIEERRHGGPFLLISWRDAVTIGEFTYKPLVMKVATQSVKTVPNCPSSGASRSWTSAISRPNTAGGRRKSMSPRPGKSCKQPPPLSPKCSRCSSFRVWSEGLLAPPGAGVQGVRARGVRPRGPRTPVPVLSLLPTRRRYTRPGRGRGGSRGGMSRSRPAFFSGRPPRA